MESAESNGIRPGDLLGVEEAAQLATVRPSTIRAWLGQGKLPRVKVGRCTRILRRDLEELINTGRRPTPIDKSAPILAKQPEGSCHGDLR